MITKNFEKALDKKYQRFSSENYFKFMIIFRKELLGMILGYEDFFADKIIRNFKIMSWSLKEVEKIANNKDTRPDINITTINEEVRKNQIKKLISIFNKKNNKLKNTKLRILFDNLSIGDKIRFIKNLDIKKLSITLQQLTAKKDSYVTHKKIIDSIDHFLIPFLEYLRDVRNILSHKMISPNQDSLFSLAFSRAKREYKHNFFIKVLRDQFIFVHNLSFNQCLEKAISSLPSWYQEIFQEVMSQSIFQKI